MCLGESVSVWGTHLPHLKPARLGGALGFEVFLVIESNFSLEEI